MIGYLFGSGRNQRGNIAGFSLLVAGVLLVVFTGALLLVMIYGTDSGSISKKDEVVTLGGLITTTLGFLFGRTLSS